MTGTVRRTVRSSYRHNSPRMGVLCRQQRLVATDASTAVLQWRKSEPSVARGWFELSSLIAPRALIDLSGTKIYQGEDFDRASEERHFLFRHKMLGHKL